MSGVCVCVTEGVCDSVCVCQWVECVCDSGCLWVYVCVTVGVCDSGCVCVCVCDSGCLCVCVSMFVCQWDVCLRICVQQHYFELANFHCCSYCLFSLYE